ncbi:hypothetical protein [Streptomyces sp. NPDC002547]
MPERLTFTLAGRDELSRVLNNTADSADRLRLRMAGITADSDGQLRDLQGRYLSVADAQRRLDDQTRSTRDNFDGLGKAAGKVGEALKANLISLLPAAIPAAAGLANAVAAVGAQLGAGAVAAVAYGIALKGQITGITNAVAAHQKYQDAVAESGAGSEEAAQAQLAYQKALAKLPPETQRAAVAVGLLKDNFQDWSDSLAGDVVGPFNKGIAVANALLPKTTGLAKSASTQVDRLVTELGGAVSTPGFDRVSGKFTDFADRTLDHAVDELNIFLAKLDSGGFNDSGLQEFLDYAKAQGPAVFDTLENVGDAVLNILQAGSDVGVGMLDLINGLSGIVSAVPPEAISVLLQLAIAIKAVKLASVGVDAARVALVGLGAEIGRMRANAARTPGALAGVGAAINGLSRTAKLAVAGTGLGLLLIAVTELSKGSRNAAPDMDKLTTSVGQFAQTGKATGELARVFGKDLQGLADDLETVSKSNKVLEFFDKLSEGFGLFSKGEIHQSKDDLQALDDALASLVSGGKANLAAEFFDRAATAARKGGRSTKELTDQLDNYKNALAGQALEQDLVAQSMGLFGKQAQDVQAKLAEQKLSADGLRQSIQALNDVNRQAAGGQIAMEAAIDAANKAVEENGATLDVSTEKGRANRQAILELASSTDDYISKLLESGASWDTVNAAAARGRDSLVATLTRMTKNGEEAERLADQYLKIPPQVKTVAAFVKQDAEKSLATMKSKLAAFPKDKKTRASFAYKQAAADVKFYQHLIDQLHGKTVTVRINGVATGVNAAQYYSQGPHKAQGGLIHRAAGGPIPGFPGGGLLQGPGTPTSDSILLWGSTGEYMMRAASVDKYGVALFDALNRGDLPVGRAAPRAGLPAAAPVAAATVAGSGRPPVTYNIYPRKSVIDAGDLELLQRQEEARQRVGRPR